MKIIFLTECLVSTGYGHIMRCLSLCQAFEDRDLFPEFIVNADNSIGEILKGKKCTVYNWVENTKLLVEQIFNTDILFIDSYLAKKELYELIHEFAKTIVYIDDNNLIDYPGGIILNGGIGAENIGYKSSPGKEYLLGLKYQPVRKEFKDVDEKIINENIQNIIVTMGGNDRHNLLPRIADLICRELPETKIHIVTGEKISDQLFAGKYKINFHCQLPANEIKQLMMASDLAISAGGQTLYELALTGVPSIVIEIADNQHENITGWANLGISKIAGSHANPVLFDNIKSHIIALKEKKIREEIYHIAKSSFNSNGANNSISEILKIHIKKNLHIRPAKMDDIMNVFNLSNEEEVRNNSFSTEKIEYENHETWFAKKITDPNVLFLIIEIERIFAGQIRYEMENANSTVSISFRKNFRGLGLGTLALTESAKVLIKYRPDVNIVKAFIKASNISSIKIFRKAGYVESNNPGLANDNLKFILKTSP